MNTGGCLVFGEDQDSLCGGFETDNAWEGDLAEIIAYSEYPSDGAVQQQINSYLALKYGITLSDDTDGDSTTREAIGSHQEGDYIASDGSTYMFDISAFGSYVNDVAGIGMDDASGLNQTSSTSVNADSLLTVSNPSDLENLEFLGWGNDDGSLITASTEIPSSGMPANATVRLTREWYTRQNGVGTSDGVGTVTVAFDLMKQSALDKHAAASDYALLINYYSGDFSTVSSIHTTGASITDGVISFTGVNLRDILLDSDPYPAYITLAGPPPSGPGGVTGNLNLWFKADAGVTNTGGAADNAEDAEAWEDHASGITLDHNTSPAIGGTYPTYYSSRMNYNPALEFDDTTDRLGADSVTLMPTDDLFMVSVYSRPTLSPDASEALYAYGPDNDFLLFFNNNQTISSYITSASTSSTANWDDDNPHITAVRRTGSTHTQLFDGSQIMSASNSTTATSGYCLVLGEEMDSDCGDFDTGQAWEGDLAEFLVYDAYPTDGDQQKILSYLALKYGITLDQSGATSDDGTGDYLDSGANVIWDAHDGTTQVTHRYDIAGIGRDDISEFSQIQSRSENDDSILDVSNASDLEDQEFLVWANNNTSASTSSTDRPTPGSGSMPTNATIRLAREWYMRSSGGDGVGTVTIAFDLDDLEAIKNSGSALDYALLIDSDYDTDSSFADATVHTTGASFNNNEITFTSVSITDGDYITLAGPPPATVDTVAITGEDETEDLALTYNLTPTTARAIVDWQVDSSSLAVLNMPFEGNGGSESTTTKDYSDSSNNGTVSGATWSSSSGVDGHGAYSFNGTSDYIGGFGDTYDMGTQDFSMEAWFKTSSDDRGFLMSKLEVWGSNNPGYWMAHLETQNIVKCYGVTAESNQIWNLAADSTTNDGSWHHVVCSIDRDGYARLYVDGDLDDSVDISAHSSESLDNDHDFFIGKRDNTATPYYFNGYLDELKMYDHALTSEQVEAIYNSGSPDYDTIADEETTAGEVWQACVTPNDGSGDGTEVCSNTTQIKPTVDSNTLPAANEAENLVSTYVTTPSDAKAIFDWKKDQSSFAELNMPFEANNGSESSTSYDYSDNSHDATVSGPTFLSSGGADGNGAYSFDGSNDSMSLGDVDFISSEEFTLSVWLYNQQTKQAFIIGDEQLSNGGLMLQTNSSGYIQTYISGYQTSSYQLPLNEWHQVVYRQTSAGLELIVDGGDYTETLTTGKHVNTNHPLYLGAFQGSSRYYNGDMDDLMIFSSALSDEQISALYNSGTPDHSTIAYQETTTGEDWQACITPNAGGLDGDEVCSSEITITTTSSIDTISFTGDTVNDDLVLSYTTTPSGLNGIVDWQLNGDSLAVLNMPFEANGGSESTTTKDYSDNSNDGTVSGATWSSSSGVDSNGAYSFDGTDDYILVPDSSSIEPQEAITISAWIYADDISTNQYYQIFRKEDGSNRILFSFQNYGTVLAWGLNTGAYEELDVSISDTDYEGQWVHLVATYDGADKKLYRNGVQIGTVQDTDGLTTGGSADACIGCGSFSGEYFDGLIDEFMIFDRALSADQISHLYNSGTPDFGTIDSLETDYANTWQVCVTPNNGVSDGDQGCSSSKTFLPEVDSVVITGADVSDALNLSYNLSPSNARAVTDWKKNQSSIAVLNMPFEGNGGSESTTTKDYSDSSNDGTVSSATWSSSSGVDGHGAYSFAGTGDYVRSDSNIGITGTADRTVCLWIKAAQTYSSSCCATPWAIGSNSSGQAFGTYANNGYWSFFRYLNDIGTGTAITTDWEHHCVAYNGTNVIYYINGTEVINQASSLNTGASPIYFGVDTGQRSSTRFQGLVDDAQVFDFVLSPEQVSALYNSGTPDYDTIVDEETTAGEEWQACVTPNYSIDGTEVCSNSVTLKPTVDSATLAAAKSHEDLELTATTTPANARKIIDWKKDQSSIAVLNMPFEANGGSEETSTLDYSDYGNDSSSIDSGINWSSTGGVDGHGAYDFPGSSGSNIDIPYHSSIKNNTAFSVSTWFKPDTLLTGNRILAMNGNTGNANFILYANNAYIGFDGSGGWCAVSGGANSTGSWIHQVGTYDGQYLRIYRDGSLLNTTDCGSNVPDTDTYGMTIGTFYAGDGYFDGMIDEFMMFDRALTDEQVEAMYNSGAPDYTAIAAEETLSGEDWQACITPNAGGLDGTEVCSNEITITPGVTDESISIAGGTGTAGAYIVSDTVTVTWDNSGTGDNNPDLTGATADLSGWGGSATATMTDTTTCGGTAGDDIYEACYTLVAGTIDTTGVNTSVTATSANGSTTGSDTTGATVDNEPPTLTVAAISVTGASGSGGEFVFGDSATGRWDNSATGDNNTDTISAVSFDLSDWISTATDISGSDSTDIWTTVAQSPLDEQTDSNNNVTVTVTDNAGNQTVTAGTNNYDIDTSTVSPGGVNGNLNFWLRADSSSVSQSGNGTSATDWTDLSSNAYYFDRTTSGIGGSDPTWYASRMNYNPVISFSGSDDRLGIAGFTGIPTGDHFITTVYQRQDSNDEYIWTYGAYDTAVELETTGYLTTYFGQSNIFGTSVTTGDDGHPHIVTTDLSGTTFRQQFDGQVVASDGSYSASSTTGACLVLGEFTQTSCVPYGSGYDFEGDIAEMVAYSSALSTADQLKVHAYLALKYGISLAQDYFASDSYR